MYFPEDPPGAIDRASHLLREATRSCSVMCGDPTSDQWQEDCDWLCVIWTTNVSAPCSEQTPDYCQCGDEQCAQGEYCCTCLDLE
jgi:hypothetical protein